METPTTTPAARPLSLPRERAAGRGGYTDDNASGSHHTLQPQPTRDYRHLPSDQSKHGFSPLTTFDLALAVNTKFVVPLTCKGRCQELRVTRHGVSTDSVRPQGGVNAAPANCKPACYITAPPWELPLPPPGRPAQLLVQSPRPRPALPPRREANCPPAHPRSSRSS